MASLQALRDRLAEVEPNSFALEEAPQERRELTEAVTDFGHRILDELADRRMWEKGTGDPSILFDIGVPEEPQPIEALLEVIEKDTDGPGLQPASGGHLGYIPGGGIYAGALGDYIAAVTNRYAGVFYAGPGAVRLENMLLRWLCSQFGYPETSLGTLTSGGSIATLVAVTAARDAHGIRARDVENRVIYTTTQAHHCVAKAIAISGLRDAVHHQVPIDANYRMDASALRAQIEEDKAHGLTPFLLVATAGTTDTGAMDPLDALADVAEEHGLWYHVDAAYGGAFVLLDEMREPFQGIERSDSVVADPHKGLFNPYGTGAVLLKDPAHLAPSHGIRGAYLQDAVNLVDEPSPSDLSPELTRHFRGLRMWLPLALHGLERHRAALEEKLLLARIFHAEAKALGFKVGPEPDLSVALFRWVPEEGDANAFNERLLQAVLDDGRVFLSSTTIDGVFWIRVAILCFRTHQDRIDAVLEVLRRETAG